MTRTAPNSGQHLNKKLLLLAGLMVCCLPGASPVWAQYSSDGSESTTAKTPLIQGATWSQANVAPAQGAPPPIGSGATPMPVTAGMSGSPNLPNWVTNIPVDQIDQSNSAANLPYNSSVEMAPYTFGALLTPNIPKPPSTPGVDPGVIQTNPNNKFTPPAYMGTINPAGGIVGTAPITKWAGQTVRDLGLNQVDRSNIGGKQNKLGSQTTDFGQNIPTLPSVTSRGITVRISQDGPRAFLTPAQFTYTSDTPSPLPQAQMTQNLNGNRIMFKGPNLPARMTIAPY